LVRNLPSRFETCWVKKGRQFKVLPQPADALLTVPSKVGDEQLSLDKEYLGGREKKILLYTTSAVACGWKQKIIVGEGGGGEFTLGGTAIFEKPSSKLHGH